MINFNQDALRVTAPHVRGLLNVDANRRCCYSPRTLSIGFRVRKAIDRCGDRQSSSRTKPMRRLGAGGSVFMSLTSRARRSMSSTSTWMTDAVRP